jgi:hypothetical protein
MVIRHDAVCFPPPVCRTCFQSEGRDLAGLSSRGFEWFGGVPEKRKRVFGNLPWLFEGNNFTLAHDVSFFVGIEF